MLAVWRHEAVPVNRSRYLVEAIRQGCVQRRYWLRAYAVLPGKLALLLYPLEDPAGLLAYFDSLTGGAPGRFRLIGADAELERAARYVESLPVRSHLAARPEDYPWSSLGWIGSDQCANVITPQGP